MPIYFLKRFALIFPTLFFIVLVNFFIIQTAPGGPVEKFINQLNHQKISSETFDNSLNFKNLNFDKSSSIIKYQGSQGIDPEIISKIEKLYGFDLPLVERFWLMLKKFIIFDFGESFYQDKKISDLLIEKFPVSLSLGLFSTLIIYIVSIPLGIKKALNDGSKFDIVSSAIIIILYAIPAFLLAIFLLILFCGGNFLNIFPLRGLTSDNFSELNIFQKTFDYLWHLFLPISAMVIGGFASLTFFCKNSFIEEINKNYVITAYAKGLQRNQIVYRHILQNALLIVIANLPSTLLIVFFTSSLLIEIIFSLDGLGLLGYEAILNRDYSLIFATLYLTSLIGLVTNIITDLCYFLIDPRINFSK
ncbi:ABC transporter permease [Alphaproteobacteria bacterium]|nr:ABC transporter permease [Alphaproteobacteria bacterium]